MEGCASRALAELQWGREGGKEEGEEDGVKGKGKFQENQYDG